MRILQPEEPSLLVAFFSAPLITPVVAIPLAGLLPLIYQNELDLLITLPFVVAFSLIYGYLGMIFVCLPVMILLHLMKRFNAFTICLATTLIGASIWTYLFHDIPGPERKFTPIFTFIVGAGCSLGVSAFFCLLGGITIRSSRDRFAARLKW